MIIMNAQLIILEKHYGRPSMVAEALGISGRQYRRIKKNDGATQTISLLVSELILKIQELEKSPAAHEQPAA